MAIAEFVIPLFFEVICYSVGRFLVPILSLGTARAEGFKDSITSSTVFYRRENGIVLSAMVTGVIGLITLIGFCVLAYFLSKL